jgi:hypothetical protein
MTTATAEKSHVRSREDEAAHHMHDKPSYEDINVPVIILVGVISAILTFLTIVFVQGMCYHWQNYKINSRSLEVENMPANIVIEEQKALLKGSNGTTSIDDAMKKVIAEYGKK